MTNENIEIIKTTLIIALGAYFGWLIFEGLNELLPFLAKLEPVLKIIVGVGALWLFVKLGWRRPK